ncbi:MAG: SH3 domain-containing protein [Anaerolineae bacterium]
MKKLTGITLLLLLCFNVLTINAQQETLADLATTLAQDSDPDYRISMFFQALEASSYLEDMANPNVPKTVFVVNDTDFQASLDQLGMSFEEFLADYETFIRVMSYHVIYGAYSYNDLPYLMTDYNSIYDIPMTESDGDYSIGSATIQIKVRNLEVSNGTLMYVTGLILPVSASGAVAPPSEYTAAGCPVIVSTAIASADESCSGIGRNQICYGNSLITAETTDPALVFGQPSDIVGVTQLTSLITAPLDEVNDLWGIAILSLQATLPDTLPGQNVTMVVFGDARLSMAESETVELITLDGTISADGSINVRSGPGTSFTAVTNIASGTAVVIDGRNDASDWLRVRLPDGQVGWVAAFLLDTAGDVQTLSVVEGTEGLGGALQAFYFSSSIGNEACAGLPASGVMVQTPYGVGQVQFMMNDVQISLGSTAFISSTDDNDLALALLQGEAIVTADNVTQTVESGYRVTVPMSDTMTADGPPSEPETFDPAHYSALPVNLLSYDYALIDFLTQGASDICSLGANVQTLTDGSPNPYYNPGGSQEIFERCVTETVQQALEDSDN